MLPERNVQIGSSSCTSYMKPSFTCQPDARTFPALYMPAASTCLQPHQTTVCQQSKPDAVFIGLPPEHHGSIDDPKRSIELELAEVCESDLLLGHRADQPD